MKKEEFLILKEETLKLAKLVEYGISDNAIQG